MMKCSPIIMHRVRIRFQHLKKKSLFLVYDHGAISIAVCRSPSQGLAKFFDRVTEKIEKYRELNVSGRRLRVRYVRERGIEGEWLAASNWGDLQLYRKTGPL